MLKFLIIAIVILLLVIVFFAIVDRLLKAQPKKKTPEKKDTNNSQPDVQMVAPKPETVAKKSLTIYNSELADDLQTIINNGNTAEPTRLELASRINKESRIAKYLQEKRYGSFNFDTSNDFDDQEETEPQVAFTKEDYKKFIALSNIEDKK